MFLGFSPRVKIAEHFKLLRLVHRLRLRKLTTLEFIVFDWFKGIEPSSTTLYDPRIRSKSVQPWASAEIFSGANFEILFILIRLLTIQRKRTFTNRFALSTPLVCAGWTSILNLLSEMFPTLRLSEMLFLFKNCLISSFSNTSYK